MSYEIFKFETPKLKQHDSELIYVSRSTYDQNWHSTIHSHNFTEIFYIIRGKGSFLLTNKIIDVKKNDLFIINPNVDHTEKSDNENPLEYIAMGVKGLVLNSGQEGVNNFQYNREDFLFYLNTIISELANKQPDYEHICQHLFSILITKLTRDYEVGFEKVGNETKTLNKDISIVKNYMHHHYRETITLDILAEVAHLNKFHLAHTFKKTVGLSPIEYLNQIRLNDSKNLLENTDYSIMEIASLTGFSSQSFFTQAFKRMTGLTPSEYRKSEKK